MFQLFNNISVKRRLIFGFASILLLSLIAIVVSITRLNSVAAATRHMIDEPMATERYLQDWYRYCLLYTSPSPRDGLLSRMPSSA